MLVLVIRRSLQSVAVLVAMSLLVFAAVYAVGDPVDILIDPQANRAGRARAIAALGIDRPLWEQYFRFLSGVVRGDLGHSFAHGTSALGLILERMPATLELALAATLLSVVVGIPLGLWAGSKPAGVTARTIGAGSILALSFPTFWVGVMLILVFAVMLGWLPASGRGETTRLFGPIAVSFLSVDGWKHLVMPATSLALFDIALLIRRTRSGMREALLLPYVKLARAKGLAARRVIGVHVLANVLVPLVAFVGIRFGSLVVLAIVAESVFAWSGMGKLLLDSIGAGDRPVVVAYVVVIVTFLVATRFAVGIVHSALDPRLRSTAASMPSEGCR